MRFKQGSVHLARLFILLLLGSLACNAPSLGNQSVTEPTPAAQVAAPTDTPSISTQSDETTAGDETTQPAGDEQTTETETADQVPDESETVEQLPDEPDVAVGLSRARPIPLGETASTDDWDVQVLQTLRGDAAYQRLLEDDGDTPPAPAGMEYVVAQIRVRCKIMDEYSHSVGLSEALVTGSSLLGHTDRFFDVPGPELAYTDVYAAEELVGWVDATVPVDESNLIFVWRPSPYSGAEQHRYLELEPGASVAVPADLDSLPANDLGVDSANPAPLGQTAVSKDWELTVLQVLRGEEALAIMQQISEQNKGADEGMELIMARVRLRYIGQEDGLQTIGGGHLDAGSSRGERFDAPRTYVWQPYDPPYMMIGFFRGGQHEGWTSMQAPAGESDVRLVFAPGGAENVRYMALEP